MGWKALKEKFEIKHIVQVRSEGVLIGSPYVSDLVTINPETGVARESDIARDFIRKHYPSMADANPKDIASIIAEPDTFSTSTPIYTYEDGEIVEKQCEVPEWPNVTHDGRLIYENTFSTDKNTVIAWAKQNAESGIKWQKEAIEEKEKELIERRDRLVSRMADLAKLNADYPAIKTASANE